MGAAESDDVKRFLDPQSPLDPYELYEMIDYIRNPRDRSEHVQDILDRNKVYIEEPVVISIENFTERVDSFRLSYNNQDTAPISAGNGLMDYFLKEALNQIVPSDNQVKIIKEFKYQEDWSKPSFTTWSIYFKSHILPLKVKAEDPNESDLPDRLTVTNANDSIVLNIAQNIETYIEASLTFLIVTLTKRATLETCEVNKELRTLQSAVEAEDNNDDYIGIASSQKVPNKKLLRYIPNKDILQILQSLCSAVANVTKPTLEYDTLSVSYPISDETSFSDPYPLFYRDLPVLFELVRKYEKTIEELQVHFVRATRDKASYLLKCLVHSLTNPKCPHIRIKDGSSFIVKGGARLTPQENEIYEGFGNLIGRLFIVTTEKSQYADIQRMVVKQLFQSGLLSIDILRPYTQEKSFVSHFARVCYANKLLGRLSDLLLPPPRREQWAPWKNSE